MAVSAPAQNPLGVLSSLLQLRDVFQQQQMQAIQMREAEAQQQRRVRFESIVRNHPDPDEAVTALQAEFPEEALKLQGTLLEQRKNAVAIVKGQLENYETELGHVRDLAQAVHDADGKGYVGLKDVVTKRLGQAYADLMDPDYNPETYPRMLRWGYDEADRVKLQKDAADAARAMLDGANTGLEVTSKLLRTAQNADQWQDGLTRLQQLGVPRAILDQAGSWSPEAPQRVAALGQAEKPPSAPSVGSFEDYVLRLYPGRAAETLTAAEIETARRRYSEAGREPQRPVAGYEPTMPSEYKTALDRAIMSIPAIRRGSVVQTANRLWSEGNTDELKDVIRQAAVESEPVDARNQIMGRMATIASLKDTEAILNEMQTAGVPTNWLRGNAEDLARRLGMTTNPKYVELGNRLMGTLINYRRAATGVQFSQRESQDYQRMFPNYRNELPVNLALIRGLMREMQTYDERYWTHKLGPSGSALVGMTERETGGPADYVFDPKTGKLTKVGGSP